MMPRLLFLSACLLAGAPLAQAVSTHGFADEGYRLFNEGKLENLALDNRGYLRPGPALELVGEIDAPVVWAAVPAPDGSLILATGHEGQVVRWRSGEPSQVLFRPVEPLIRALTIDESGNIFAGTSPTGAVYRLRPNGQPPEVFYDPDASYIWDLKVREGALWVATGLPAKLIRVPLDNPSAAEEWFDARADHLLVARPGAEGSWWLGSSPDGVLYQVSAPGQARAVFNADEKEIRDLALLDNGELFFATFEEQASAPPPPPPNNDGNTLPPFVVSSESPSEPSSGGSSGGRSVIYRLGSDGFVERVFQTRRTAVLTLQPWGGRYLILGTNDAGKIFSFESRDQWAILQQATRGGEVGLFLPDGESTPTLLLITSNPGAVYRLGGSSEVASTYTSAVEDATQIVRWGQLQILHEGSLEVTAETRSGNAKDPQDGTWSPWSAVPLEAQQGQSVGAIASPKARYLQYRLTLTEPPSGRGSVQRVQGFFQLPNAAPVLANVEALPFGAELVENQVSAPALEFDKVFEPRSREQFINSSQTHRQLRRVEGDSLMTIAWRAQDPNGDTLRYTLRLLRPVDNEAGILLATDLDQPFWSFNTRGFAEGHYRAEVTATDALANAGDEARTTTLTSGLFVIDHTPPQLERVEATLDPGFARFRFLARDDWNNVRAAQYRLNGGDAIVLRPVDGLFDARHEELLIELSGLRPGPHTLLVEAIDGQGLPVTYQETFNAP